MADEAEVWLPIPRVGPLYEVSSRGRVRSLKGSEPRILRQGVWENGYPRLTISRRTIEVHRAMGEAFLPGSGDVVRHLNDVKTDNRLENLAWGSFGDNARDAVMNGTHGQGKKTHCRQGHAYNEANTYLTSKGKRRCRICNRAAVARYTQRKKEE